jgi:hypothetical protein
MSFEITLETENNEILEKIYEDGRLLHFPGPNDKTFYCIKYIDDYGNTVFNRLQMDDFITEMRILQDNSENPKTKDLIEDILKLAYKCKHEVHTYIKFYGD